MTNLRTLTKERTTDPTTLEKALHMCARHSDQEVSDYLGIPVPQVAAVRRRRGKGVPRGRPRKVGP